MSNHTISLLFASCCSLGAHLSGEAKRYAILPESLWWNAALLFLIWYTGFLLSFWLIGKALSRTMRRMDAALDRRKATEKEEIERLVKEEWDRNAQLHLAHHIEANVQVCITARVDCPLCKNYFFVQHVEIEQPTCCPYCHTVFAGAIRNDD